MNYVALDIGNVLCKIDFSKILSFISKELNISIKEVEYKLSLSQKFQDVGFLGMKGILFTFFNIKSEQLIDEILNIWNNDVLIFDDRPLKFFNELYINHNLKIALLSNIGIDHSIIVDKYLNNNYSFANNAIRHYSCNIGVRKPQSLFYKSFLLDNPEFENCVYLDDLPENLKSASKFNFRSVEFNLLNFEFKQLKHIKDMILFKI